MRAGSLCNSRLNGGESGIRTHGTFQYTRFPSVRLKPLGHLSASSQRQAGPGTAPHHSWRRGRDSNPRWVSPHTPLAGERLQPLGHLSGRRQDTGLCGREGEAWLADSETGKCQVRPRISSIHPSVVARVWRRGRDSNPRGTCAPGGFQDRCLQPLGHLSASELWDVTALLASPCWALKSELCPVDQKTRTPRSRGRV